MGRLDIIVGTHRLLSKDVKFHDLGLLVRPTRSSGSASRTRSA